jgi:hypothetical protein
VTKSPRPTKRKIALPLSIHFPTRYISDMEDKTPPALPPKTEAHRKTPSKPGRKPGQKNKKKPMGLIQCCDKERVEKRSRIVNIKNILESAPPPEFPNRPDTEKRHGIKPTDEERDFVITAIVLGVPRATIASLLHIGEDSLRKHYRAELEYGKQIFGIEAVAALRNLVQQGKESSVQFALKTKFGWVEKQSVEHSGGVILVPRPVNPGEELLPVEDAEETVSQDPTAKAESD